MNFFRYVYYIFKENMETTINYYQSACGKVFANKDVTTWKKLHDKKCDKCSKSSNLLINKGIIDITEINKFNKENKIIMNNHINKFENKS